MKRRIFGLESEYGIVCMPLNKGGRPLPVQNAVTYLFKGITSGRMYPDVFLENGARFYQDIGCHPEYATPECDNVYDLVVHDKAGERIVEELMIRAERALQRDGFNHRISIFKNNTDSRGNTYGCHENYLMDRHVSLRQLATQLIPFFVTRQIYTGAGKVKSSIRGGYAISQRAQYIREDISIATTTARGIINTRDEPHADREKYRRLHVIVGDSNMSEFTNYLKVGTTHIVLMMIEDGFLDKRMALYDSVKAMQQISEDLSCKKTIELESGKRLTPVEIQRYYLEAAHRYFETEEIDPVSKDVLKKWAYVLDKIAEDPMQLDREIDWVIKKRMIETYVNRRRIRWDDARVHMLDLQYHNIRRKVGLYYILEREGRVERIATDEAIEHAMRNPPETTRAKFRGQFVKLANEQKILCGVNWSYIQLYEPCQQLYLSTDPLDPVYEEASKGMYSF
ncbi:TPA: Pup--protein ligase [Candidatus Poribacteria bacterium]|nr:Pup--protein ligase [Candidatus Poribacteria bacterium]HEX29166.1 Pup--protein ligase [Candidatus Poribacteria bacterium]